MESKKIILFIVEGITDQISLAAVLDQIFSGSKVSFQLTNGDLTTRENQTPATIVSDVGRVVKEFCGNIFTPKDFLEIIHVVDTDGAFIPEEDVRQKAKKELNYTDECILTNHAKSITKRNVKKAENIEKLLSVKTVCKTIPYSVYYFSSNLEHVLHDRRNLKREEKQELAEQFEEKYLHDLDGFKKLITAEEIAVAGDYEETWEFIKKEENSLKRYTNFALCLRENID